MTILNILLPIILCLILIKLKQTETIDKTHPYGTDMIKNKKYTPKIVGEGCGVNDYWGKPNKKDKLIDRLNKIQWLSNTFSTEIVWRQSLIFAIIASIVATMCSGISYFLRPDWIMLYLSMFFIISYFTISYYKTHTILRKSRYINTHIRNIKSKLNLSIRNKIMENESY